jgi:N-acetylmuramic acid 6-phosphate etherase
MMLDLAELTTERANPLTARISDPSLSTVSLLTIINDEDEKIASAVRKNVHAIARVVDKVAERMKKGGRAIYFGQSHPSHPTHSTFILLNM